jgi:beta-1,4-N-acetylglucosaminyltransferase
MKYLVSVGTTSFDTLINFLDSSNFQAEFIFQIADGLYIPQNHSYFRFENDIFEKYCEYVPIIHCGAGSIYSLLEKNVRFLCIPNLERQDKHQLDIARFVDDNRLAIVSRDFSELKHNIQNVNINSYDFNKYRKNQFFMGKDISSFITNESK